MNVKMKAQETSTLSQPKKLASRIQTSPQSQRNSSNKSQPMSQSNPFHKRETIKSSALPDYGLHSDRSRGEFAVSAAISPASFNRNNFKEPQAQEQVQPVPLQHSKVRPEKSPFPLGQSQQYLQPLPQLQGSVNTWQAPAQPYQDLQPSIQIIPLVAPQPTQLTPQDKKATYQQPVAQPSPVANPTQTIAPQTTQPQGPDNCVRLEEDD